MNYARSQAGTSDIINNRAISSSIGIVFFILATALGAYVRIPVYGSPVPITLQTFFVIMAGAILGKRSGFYSQIGYIVAGAAGLPLFQGASFGTAYLLGPTGGYLIGFAVCALLVGSLINRCGSNSALIMAVFALGSLAIYASGVIWLVAAYRMDPVSAISAGVAPFVVGDMAKIALATLIYSKISKRSNRIFSA